MGRGKGRGYECDVQREWGRGGHWKKVRGSVEQKEGRETDRREEGSLQSFTGNGRLGGRRGQRQRSFQGRVSGVYRKRNLRCVGGVP